MNDTPLTQTNKRGGSFLTTEKKTRFEKSAENSSSPNKSSFRQTSSIMNEDNIESIVQRKSVEKEYENNRYSNSSKGPKGTPSFKDKRKLPSYYDNDKASSVYDSNITETQKRRS